MVIIVQNWVLGQFMCYFLPMLQDIPLHAVLLSHLLIGWDRMRWLNDPMNSRLPSLVCSCATWLTGMVIVLPYPIYTTYLDLGHQVSYWLMYTSKELHPPDGELSVMMYEQRADIIAHRQKRHSTASSTRSGASRHSYTRSYDLYDAEADASREQRTQCFLGGMAACEVICICPLMILRFARTQLAETYENSAHFDVTYLMFVWMAFLPTVINPCVYACWILSGPAKDRLRRYFRLSSKRSDSENKLKTHRSGDNSVAQENTTETMDIEANFSFADRSNNRFTTKSTNATGGNVLKPKKPLSAVRPSRALAKTRNKDSASQSAMVADKSYTSDEVNNSCSNITTSTYCNGNGVSTSSGIGLEFDNNVPYADRRPLGDRDSVYSGASGERYSHRSRDFLSEVENLSVRRESSSTYERDMDIIDLLERERSMDIQEIIAREKCDVDRPPRKKPKPFHSAKSSLAVERHRKLPDITKIASPNSPKRPIPLTDADPSSNFPNFVFTHQHNEFAEARSNRNRSGLHGNYSGSVNSTNATGIGSRRSSQTLFVKRNSIIDEEERSISSAGAARSSRTRSIGSRKGSTKSARSTRVHSGKYEDNTYSNNF